MDSKRQENLGRLTGFHAPSRRSAWYLHYRYFFAALRHAFAQYIKRGDYVFDIGCGNPNYDKYTLNYIFVGQKP